MPPYTLWLQIPNSEGAVAPDAIEKSEISAAGGVVPVHNVVTGGLQVDVEPPVDIVAAPPVALPDPPTSVAAPPVGFAAAPPVGFAAAPPVAFAAPPVAAPGEPPVAFAPPPTEFGAPPVALVPVVPPPLVVPPSVPAVPPVVTLVLPALLGALLFVVDEPHPTASAAITKDLNPIADTDEVLLVVMA